MKGKERATDLKTTTIERWAASSTGHGSTERLPSLPLVVTRVGWKVVILTPKSKQVSQHVKEEYTLPTTRLRLACFFYGVSATMRRQICARIWTNNGNDLSYRPPQTQAVDHNLSNDLSTGRYRPHGVVVTFLSHVL